MNHEVFRSAYDSMLPDEKTRENTLKNIIDMASEQMPKGNAQSCRLPKQNAPL